MLEIAPRAELMRSLGRLVRGLSALFWGLPLSLVISVYVATNEWLKPSYMFLPTVALALLLYALFQLGSFQKQERIWIDSLDRTKLLSVVTVGLSPFIYWHNHMPDQRFYSMAVFLLMLTGLLFLFNLNHVVQRLAAMLPDETLRMETRLFGNLNLSMISAIVVVFTAFYVLAQLPYLPRWLLVALTVFDMFRHWLLVFLVLLPIAMTMTLLWKIKEVIFASVFSHDQ